MTMLVNKPQITKDEKVGTHKLQKITALLRCEKSNHADCIELLEEVRRINNVTYAETTNAVLEDDEFCVIADALVKSGEIEKFDKKLEEILNRGKAVKKTIFISQ